jgi:transglutaminase-like putative cysteine protease
MNETLLPSTPVRKIARGIDRRACPPVKGIDLEQSMNYLDLAAFGEALIYNHYTSSRLFYQAGSRPVLERVTTEAIGSAHAPLDRIQAIASWVSRHVKWAGYYRLIDGKRLPDDTAATEETLIERGYAWCNEQARLFCLMTQIAGIPSRMVFASDPDQDYGHCTAEVLVDKDWMLVDQSFGYCFIMDGKPVRASQLYHNPETRRHFTPIYNQFCTDLKSLLGDYLQTDFIMAAGKDPLEGFKHLGYINYFAH